MIPVKQTRFGKKGNCLDACIASLLNLNIDDIPDLQAYKDGPLMENLNQWLRQYRRVYIEVGIPAAEAECFFSNKDFLHVMIGYTPRSTARKIRHAVVGRKGKMVHDPHPDNTGILEDEILSIGVLVSTCL